MSRGYDAGARARANFFDIGVVGRRTGITMKSNILKDADGLDNIDDFWEDEEEQPTNDQQNDGFSGDDHYHDDQDAQHTPPRQSYYTEQELPEELLSTPTSRKSRAVPLSRGSTSSGGGSARGILLPDTGEEYASPSFHAVKKRLFFSKDSSGAESDEDTNYQHSRQAQQQATASPALDRLLHTTMEKKATKAAQSLPWASKPTISIFGKGNSTKSKPATTSSAAGRAAGGKRAQPKPMAPLATRRPDLPKAFDLGGSFDYLDDQDQTTSHNQDDFSDSVDDDQYEPYSPIESPSLPPRRTAEIARTPAEFKRKSKGASRTEPDLSDDHDAPVYREPEPRYDDHDRLRFSDEDGEEEVDELEDDNEKQVMQRRMKDPMQQKRVASVKESTASNRMKIKLLATDIPKEKASSKKKVERNGRKVPVRDSVEEEEEDERQAVSSQKARSKDKQKNKDATRTSKPKAVSMKKSSRQDAEKAAAIGRKREAPQSLVLEVPVVPDVSNQEEQGVRRSHRTRIAPLQYWKNERVLMGRNTDVAVSVPVIKGVYRAVSPEPVQLGQKRKRDAPQGSKNVTTKGRPVRRTQVSDSEEGESERSNEGRVRDRLDLKRMGLQEHSGTMEAEILVYGTDTVVQRVIAESRDAMQFRDVEGGDYKFHRGLEDADSVISGIMKIEPGGKKPANNGNACSMIFYVIKGMVQAMVHETTIVLSAGGQFLVPRGNQYSITNVSRNESHLFFVQAKTPITTADMGTSSSSSSGTTRANVPDAGEDETPASGSPHPPSTSSRKKAGTPRRRSMKKVGELTPAKVPEAEESNGTEGTDETGETPKVSSSQRDAIPSFFS
ncbi:hypothetical protein BG011_002161 [Mortierella polycephala]|uniref:Mif2/CENP-C cupin domain-containing protein n=1 Tax=Mortierella polycephala TaxID=41804 RepID=A0A9P6Q7C0_9FUNG|nr:hypothetical protein BG011_002161 [Mortierella polycephala]